MTAHLNHLSWPIKTRKLVVAAVFPDQANATVQYDDSERVRSEISEPSV